MPQYYFTVEVEYEGDEPYTDEIQDGLKNAYPQCNFRVWRAAEQRLEPDGCQCLREVEHGITRVYVNPWCPEHGRRRTS